MVGSLQSEQLHVRRAEKVLLVFCAEAQPFLSGTVTSIFDLFYKLCEPFQVTILFPDTQYILFCPKLSSLLGVSTYAH